MSIKRFTLEDIQFDAVLDVEFLDNDEILFTLIDNQGEEDEKQACRVVSYSDLIGGIAILKRPALSPKKSTNDINSTQTPTG